MHRKLIWNLIFVHIFGLILYFVYENHHSLPWIDRYPLLPSPVQSRLTGALRPGNKGRSIPLSSEKKRIVRSLFDFKFKIIKSELTISARERGSEWWGTSKEEKRTHVHFHAGLMFSLILIKKTKIKPSWQWPCETILLENCHFFLLKRFLFSFSLVDLSLTFFSYSNPRVK